VLYHADDMLERGLRLKNSRDAPQKKDNLASAVPAPENDPGDEGSSAMVTLHSGRSAEGLNQFLRALADRTARVPPHVRIEQIALDVEKFVTAVDPQFAKDNVLKRFGHFEAWFAYHWDWLTRKDSLEIAFQRWRFDGATGSEAKGVFHEGQIWLGQYFCTQGTTSLALNISKVEISDRGEEYLEADLKFTVSAKDEEASAAPAQGRYVVAGRLSSLGRELNLDPVPGSWKDKPSNFVMVGLQGVVSRTGRGGPSSVRYAGTVPILGCDSFELRSQARAPAEPPTESPTGAAAAEEWRQPLLRFRRILEDIRRRWRDKLQLLIGESGKKQNKTVTASGIGEVAQQLLEAARRAGVLNFDIRTADGEEIIISIGEGAER